MSIAISTVSHTKENVERRAETIKQDLGPCRWRLLVAIGLSRALEAYPFVLLVLCVISKLLVYNDLMCCLDSWGRQAPTLSGACPPGCPAQSISTGGIL